MQGVAEQPSIQMHLDLESSMEEAPVFKGDPFFILPSFQFESLHPTHRGFQGKTRPRMTAVRPFGITWRAF